MADTSKCRVSKQGVVVQLSRVCRGNFPGGKIGQGMRVGSSNRTRKERLLMKRDSSSGPGVAERMLNAVLSSSGPKLAPTIRFTARALPPIAYAVRGCGGS